MSSQHNLIRSVYSSFNARDIDAVLVHMHPEVDWPNGMEGGRVHGHAEVREYWRRQWKLVDPHVVPTLIEEDGNGRAVVRFTRLCAILTATFFSIAPFSTSTLFTTG